jgi:hypothetical protein
VLGGARAKMERNRGKGMKMGGEGDVEGSSKIGGTYRTCKSILF